MDYGNIISRAWRISWRHKALWILGLFGGAASGITTGGTGSSGATSSSQTNPLPSTVLTATQLNALVDYVRVHAAAVLGMAIAVLVVGLALFVLHTAARGGLVREVDEAREDRDVRVGAGWSAGFHRWWRLFGIDLVTSLPLLVIGAIAGGFFAFVAAAALRRGLGTSGLTSAFMGTTITAAGFILVFGLIALVLGVMLSIVAELAVRYAMLQDRGAIGSIRMGWTDLWSHKGAFVMWLIMLGIGVVYAIALAIVAVVLELPGVLLLAAKSWVAGGVLLAVALLALLVPSAAYGTFHSAAWTLFFRAMTGADPRPSPAPGSCAPPAQRPTAYAPPEYAPPAPPVPATPGSPDA